MRINHHIAHIQARLRRSLGLTLVLGTAVLSAVLAFIPVSLGMVSVLITVPAMLWIPGYALVYLVLPEEKQMGVTERSVLIVATSIAMNIICGMLLNWTPFGLSVIPFTVTMSIVTIICALLALSRGNQPFVLPRIAIGPVQAVWLGLAAILVVVSIMFSVHSAQTYQNTAFTQVWLLPDSNNQVTLGLHNDEGHTEIYQVQVSLNGVLVQQWTTVTLTSGANWQQQLTLKASPGMQLRAVVYRQEQPGVAYRMVSFKFPTQPKTGK